MSQEFQTEGEQSQITVLEQGSTESAQVDTTQDNVASEAPSDAVKTTTTGLGLAATDQQLVSLNATSSLVPEAPRNGIPMLTIFIDETDQAIAEAGANDPDNSYGTLQQLLDSSDHSVRGIGGVSIVVPEGYESEYGSSSVPEGMLELAFIRGRGNTTWHDPCYGYPVKRGFKVKFADKQDFFGMGASKEWALMANVYDSTLLKNRISSWLADRIGMSYAPQMVPVDVVMVRTKDGQELERASLGSYCLSELVDIEPGRIATDKLKKNDANDEDITGGYLLSYHTNQNQDEPESNVITLPSDDKYFTRTPQFESEDLTEGQAKQRAYITDYMQRLDMLVKGPKPRDPIGVLIDEARHKEIAEMLDFRSAADYWWVQAFSDNSDAFGNGSTYLYKLRGGKLCFGPVWDLDHGWCAKNASDEQRNYTGISGWCGWARALFDNDPLFAKLLWERWTDPEDGVDAALDELIRPGGKLDEYSAEIRASWEDNRGLVGETDKRFTENELISFDEAVEGLRTWIGLRRDWINENLDVVSSKYVGVSYVVGGHEVKHEWVKRDQPALSWPNAPEHPGYVFEGWCLQGSQEILVGPGVPSAPFYTDLNFETNCAGWKWKRSSTMYVTPSSWKDTVFVAKYRRDSKVDPLKDKDVAFDNSDVAFVSGADGGRVVFCARVEYASDSACDFSDARMVFDVHPAGAEGQGRTVEVPFGKASKVEEFGGRTVSTFELPLTSLEMGQTVKATFSYTSNGKPASTSIEQTLEDQILAVVNRGGNDVRASYAKAMHDFGRTAYAFFTEYGNKGVKDKYSAMKSCLTDKFDWDAAKAGINEELRLIGAMKDMERSKVDKINMSLRFDSETTVDISVKVKPGTKDFSAQASYKGKTYKGEKVSDTELRIRIAGLQAQDLGESIDVSGNADGEFNMRCSALSYAQGVLEKSLYGDKGNDFMAAVYNYHMTGMEKHWDDVMKGAQ